MRLAWAMPRRVLVGVGHHAVAACESAYDVAALMALSFRAAWRGGFPFAFTLDPFHRLIGKSLPLVAVAALSTGAVMALQFGYGMARFGGQGYVPTVVAVSFVRALGPIFTCLMVAARAGSGIAAELGGMAVTQQVDAIRALGTDPLRVLVAPRLAVLVLGVPILTLLADAAGILGGMAVATTSLGMSPQLYWEKSWQAIRPNDLWVGTLKTSLYAFGIGLIACHVGLRTSQGTVGIGQATTRAVVLASLFVVLCDVVVTKITWILAW